MRVTLLDARGQPVAGRPATAIVFQSASPEVHLIVFDQPRLCRDGINESVDVYHSTRKHGRVLAELPARWQTGEERTTRWMMVTAPADRIGSAVRAALR